MRRSIDEELRKEIWMSLPTCSTRKCDYENMCSICKICVNAITDLISQEVLKGQIQEVKDMYSWAGDNFVPRSRLRLRLSELKDLLKKEEL